MELVNGSTTSSSLINREEQSSTMREQQSSTLREQQSSSTTSSLVREEQRWSSSTDSEPAPGTSIRVHTLLVGWIELLIDLSITFDMLFQSTSHMNASSRTHTGSRGRKAVWRIRDGYPGSRILIFIHPGSRISDPGSRIPDPGSKNSNRRERWKKNCCHTFLCSHKFHKFVIYFSFEVLKKKIWENFQRIIELFTQKIVKKLLKIWSWDPRSGIRQKPIPDPGSRGQKGTGSRIRIRNTAEKVPDLGSGWAALAGCSLMRAEGFTCILRHK